jgi:hypothetical protein
VQGRPPRNAPQRRPRRRHAAEHSSATRRDAAAGPTRLPQGPTRQVSADEIARLCHVADVERSRYDSLREHGAALEVP